ncbi:MAG TPA: DUF6788 family protein [Ktedonobacteraceae bacterium]|nr:DUF6788 family protein [Ktedonobacteraceae bacterium]
MQEKVTYHQQPSFCGKPGCRKCRDGVGHGPYWYAYTTVAGQTRRTYVGKELPPEAQQASHPQKAEIPPPDATDKGFPSISRSVSLQAADEHIARCSFADAIAVLDRLLALDPTNEAAVYRLMAVLAGQKRRGEALRVYQRCVESLQRLRGSSPSQELQALYAAVRNGEPVAYPPPEPLPTPHAPGAVAEMNVARPDRAAIVHVPDASPVQIGRTHQNPLVGREEEVQALHTLLLDVERYADRSSGERRSAHTLPFDTQRHPQCALLLGDAGIGKTRLAEEVSREAQQRGWSVIWSRIYPQESGIPYRPWVELVRSALHQIGGDWMTEGKVILQSTSLRGEGQALPAYVQPLAALLPELQTLVPSIGLTALSTELEQLRLREAIRDVLIAASEVVPLVIVLDDIQWADSSSGELLGYLARHLNGYPLLLLGTCREYEMAEHPLRSLIDHMQRERTVKMLHIEPLTNEQIALLVSHMPGLPESLVQHIQTQVAGNPFFAEELARLMPPAPARLPHTITAALDARITRLSQSCQHLLAHASILGGSFEFSTISAMESATTWATPDEEDTVLDVLDEALRAGVLLEEGSAASISYTFWHPLLVTHLYERLSATRRTRLHRRAAEVLQRLHADKEQEIAATMTHHLVQAAADPRQIIHYAELAGHHAYALLAYPEAERHYRLAVEYMDIIGNRPTETTLPVSVPDAATLLERLAECSAVQGNFAEARTLYERSLKIRSQRPVADIDMHDEAQRQALLWGEIGRLWRYTGDTAQALICCERGEAVLRDAGVVTGPAWARLRYQASSFYESEGRYEEARHASQEALALFEKSPSHDTSSVAQRPSSAPPTRIERTLEGDPVDLGRTYALLGMLDYNVGQQASALAHLTSALTLYEQYDRQREIAHVTCNIGHIHLNRGEYQAAHAALRRSRSLAERIGDGPLISVIFANLAEFEVCAGNFVQAEEWYRKSLILAQRFNDRQYISLWHAELVSVLIAQGKLSEAAASASKALHMARAMRNTPCLGAALVALSNMRIAEARAIPENHAITRLRLLTHARRAVERALSLDHLYAETRIKAQEMLPRVMQLLEQETHQQA